MAQVTTATFRRLDPSAIQPTYGTQQSACFDFSACLPIGRVVSGYNRNNELRVAEVTDQGLLIWPGSRYLIPTGWAVACPTNYSLRLYSRSGLALKKGLVLINGEGVVDEDYRHEVCALIANVSGVACEITHGMRICQGEFVTKELVEMTFTEMPDALWFNTERTGGFGSTGV